MPLYTFDQRQITAVSNTQFGIEGIRERDDLQAALRDSIDVISPDTLVISEEFSEWNESKRRVDLLGIDKQANLVVLELKRDETGAHMELQALRYAAMLSTLTFKKTVDFYQKYLNKREIKKNAEEEILSFLEWSEPLEEQFLSDIRIVLASANFSKELTTTVMWLNKRNLDIRCVRLQPYKLDEKILLDVEQIIPLPEAAGYEVGIREQIEERRAASKDMTRYVFMENVYRKNRLVLAVVQKYLKDHPDTSFKALQRVFPDELQNRACAYGVVAPFEKAKQILDSTGYKRYFLNEDDILKTGDGQQVAVCTQWGIGNIGGFIEVARALGYQIEAQ